MVLQMLIGPPDEGADIPGFAIEVSRGIGLFIGTLLALAMAAGAFLHRGEEPAGPTTSTPGTPPPPAV
jgi:hypothetical protein